MTEVYGENYLGEAEDLFFVTVTTGTNWQQGWVEVTHLPSWNTEESDTQPSIER